LKTRFLFFSFYGIIDERFTLTDRCNKINTVHIEKDEQMKRKTYDE